MLGDSKRILQLEGKSQKSALLLQIVDAKRSSAKTSPWIVRSLPRFPAQKWFTTAPFGTPVFDILSEIGTDKAISSSNVELME